MAKTINDPSRTEGEYDINTDMWRASPKMEGGVIPSTVITVGHGGSGGNGSGWYNAPALQKAARIAMDDITDPDNIRKNAFVFKSIKNKRVIDIGVVGPIIHIAFQDGGSLRIISNAEDCVYREQNDLATLNGLELSDITVRPQYSIATDVCCYLTCHNSYGLEIDFAVTSDYTPTFRLEYTNAKS